MNNKLILAGLIFVFVITFTSFVRLNQGKNIYENVELTVKSPNDVSEIVQNNVGSNLNDNSDKLISELGNSNIVTNSQLSGHNSKTDCWVSYNGKVYDITSFLPNHPRSSKTIEPYCGTADEFKKAFEKQHGTSKVKNLMKVGVLIGDFDII